ncbi:sensor histidine kinase [Tolypothrix sp. VBCCA 56010]|uniref:sensor histidine kinase n=1 Tax=Tolypothrix sp. VBCCA 56010 TaxID=3137731 RepID=UPI003D7D615F
MDWSNWVYLGVGIALGLGLSALFTRRKTSSSLNVVLEQQDVSALEQEMKRLMLAYQMAREMSQFKAGFLARTTHELRSPLNGLIGLHQLILSDLCEDAAEEREFIAQAHERALKLLKLIDEILKVSRTEYGNNKLDIQPQSLAEVLQEVHSLTYMLAANRNFTLQLLPPDPDIYVLADPRWLRQVLLNLVDTSITQMEEGSISISTASSPTSKFIHICLDVPTNAIPASEPINLIKSEYMPDTDKQNAFFSPGMRLLLNQTLLEVMGGKLEIVSPVSNEPSEHYSRLQLSIPLMIPEAGFPESA